MCMFRVLRSFLEKKDRKKRLLNAQKFTINITSNEQVNDYVARMPEQYKDNSRLLKGAGKMHFSNAMEAGSDLVKKEEINVLKAIGDRFS